jgi:hypothetical protein
MTRFAFDCLENTSVVAAQLATTLGHGTSDLMLRIGMNSGPTTAGGTYFTTFLAVSAMHVPPFSNVELPTHWTKS